MKRFEVMKRLRVFLALLMVVSLVPSFGQWEPIVAEAAMPDTCANVTASVYVSVYEPLSGKTVCSQNGGIVLNSYPEFDVNSFDLTVHVPEGLNYAYSFSQIHSDSERHYVEPNQFISGGSATITGIYKNNGEQIYLNVGKNTEAYTPDTDSFFVGFLSGNTGSSYKAKVRLQDSNPSNSVGEYIFLEEIRTYEEVDKKYDSYLANSGTSTVILDLNNSFDKEIEIFYRVEKVSEPDKVRFYSILRRVSASGTPLQELVFDISDANPEKWTKTAFNLEMPGITANDLNGLFRLNSLVGSRDLDLNFFPNDLGKRIEFYYDTGSVLDLALEGSIEAYFNLFYPAADYSTPYSRIQYASLPLSTSGFPTQVRVSFANLVEMQAQIVIPSSTYGFASGSLELSTGNGRLAYKVPTYGEYRYFLPSSTSVGAVLNYSVIQYGEGQFEYLMTRNLTDKYHSSMSTGTPLHFTMGRQPDHLEKIMRPLPSSGYEFSAEFVNNDGDRLVSVLDFNNCLYALPGVSLRFKRITDQFVEKTLTQFPFAFTSLSTGNLDDYTVEVSGIPLEAKFLSLFRPHFTLKVESVEPGQSTTGISICAHEPETFFCEQIGVTDSAGIAHFDEENADLEFEVWSSEQFFWKQASQVTPDTGGAANMKVRVVAVNGHKPGNPDIHALTLEDVSWFAQNIKRLQIDLDLDGDSDLQDLNEIVSHLVEYFSYSGIEGAPL